MKTTLLSKITLAVALGLSLWISADADADLIGAWLFDEGQGETAHDSSANEIHGTLVGAGWADGMFESTALDLEANQYVDFPQPAPAPLMMERDLTVMAWVYPKAWIAGHNCVFSMQSGTTGAEAYGIYFGNAGGTEVVFYTTSGGKFSSGMGTIGLNEWTHTAVRYDGTEVVFFIDGERVAGRAHSDPLNHRDGTGRFAIGANYNNTTPGEFVSAFVDEVLIYDEALSQDELRKLMERGFLGAQRSPGAASDPSPENGATDVPYDVTLSWMAGAFARTHDVYFGASFEDVNAASRTNPADVLVQQGQTGTMYDLTDPLAFGQTYYWRVDEVNAPPDSTIYQGNVWRFTVEPAGYPIANVVATASSSAADKGMTPDKTVDGSGMNADDEHGTEEADMWLTAMGAPGPAWIQYEFDKDYKLHELWVWNSNQTIEDFIGFGAKDVTVEYSLDGVEWSLLGDVEFAKAPGTEGYGDYNTVDLLGVHAQFVRLTINSNWSEYMPQTGLSEVRFFRIPVRAREPQPVAEATSVAVDSVLRWRAGREAAAHEVHWGMDKQAVIDGTAQVEITTESRLTPGSMDYGQTYYWKVNEVNEAATPDTWEGDLWSFSTAEYRVVEDFESYSNEVGQRAFEVWIDGIGFTLPEPGHPGNGTGAAVGHDIWTAGGPHFEQTIMETDNVHGGLQAMPLYYDNTGTPTSEAQYTFAAEDWTAGGLKSLSLYFCGAADNSGDLYVKINDFKVPYNGDTTDITRGSWQPWNIDLSNVETDLANVTQLVIGVEGAAATGVLLIDDIRLYPREPEFITPADPGRTGLLAEYLFDNSAADTSGNGHDGTLRDNARVSNGALLLDGTTDSVAIPRIGGADATFNQCTYSMWIYSTVEPASVDFCGGINSDGWSAGGIHCKLRRGMANAGINGLDGGDMQGDTVAGAEEWVHLALTVSDTVATIYLNGQVEDSRGFAAPLTMILGNGSIGAWNNNGDIQRELTGQMDDVRIYDRALSQEEVLWLAGKRAPVHKAF